MLMGWLDKAREKEETEDERGNMESKCKVFQPLTSHLTSARAERLEDSRDIKKKSLDKLIVLDGKRLWHSLNNFPRCFSSVCDWRCLLPVTVRQLP